ncbi:helix-turn-helix transcriptional regulator [Chengkuizengella marina]|uniref:DNA-binding protein n=1 Tax=Chengkuizengella marina TaxID=2507566 RepID=A0A6N9Q7T0_9BACL|nr:DNA-binding protein [Chengkuizengella marina]
MKEAAEYTGISDKLLYRMCKEGDIPHIKLGAKDSQKPRIIFRTSTLDNWMREQESLNYTKSEEVD